MAIYVYDKQTGELYSWCPGDDDQVASDEELESAGLAKTIGLAALDPTHAWDPATKTVIVVPDTTPKPIATGTWILRFTPDEFEAISESTDKAVKRWLYALNHTTQIDLADPNISQGVEYLTSIGLLQQDRAAAVMATP